MSKLSHLCTKLFVVSTVTLASASALADEPVRAVGDVDLSALTSRINFDSVGVAIMAIGGTIITLYATVAGVKWALRFVKGV
ncbi:major capsid protein [Xenorhabdus innexi]|uniref:Membrane protein n=1 Tax=Xenorhabdus innexi TaxID=290109 RepID=A0A1N6MXY8_9GAMM|nr:major capsid protein [Xenorhabdus innexi]PHM31183.1 membrane protein [Xenorhabdus innexi]SIP73681.1 putative phage-related membrane protein [Xenorhabdus innexi]